MGRYIMHMGKDDIMGEGTSSICRRGTTKDGKTEVAIKVYKDQEKKGGKVKKFKRQINVLKELMEPLQCPKDKNLWHPTLEKVKPQRIFMQLLDHSKTARGEPGPDVSDGVLYVVTELAQYSLKDFLAQRREQSKPLSADEVKGLAKAIVIAMAGLHAKGYVHIDMKPENMMMFNGRLKVIDVDGCVRANTKISIQDSSISFSPCYCAPEWARFLIKDNQPQIVANPALDVWSVGMTLCELVTMEAILKPQYANFLRNASSHREAGFLFMEWLSSVRKAPVPKSVEKHDKGLAELITQWLLVPSQANRKTCAQALSNPYIMSGRDQEDKVVKDTEEPIRRLRDRPEDDSVQKPLHQGTLWKLNTGGNPKDDTAWIKRDMWIAHNHSLCYFSKKEDKRLVLIDGKMLSTASLQKTPGFAKAFAFEVKTKSDAEEGGEDVFRLAAESAQELTQWMDKLSKTGRLEMMVTMKLGSQMAADIDAFKLTVKNRRMKVDEGEAHAQYEPVYKGKLWKLKTEGDRKKPEDWFQREMWVAKNGSLVYFSPKEDRELVYYTAADIAQAKIDKIPEGQACHRFCFRVSLPPINNVEFTPGEFSADSEELREQWLQQMARFKS
jgi:serine/threonine protein kinase